jgi:ABC-type spermidine/putrescine transport system permease subunit I
MLSITSIIFALSGCAIIYLFQQKRKQLSRLENSDLAELDKNDFTELTLLLKTAYERTLYMGVLFLPLAYSARIGGEKISQLFFLILIGFLFISNVIPRNKIMRLLEKNGLDMKTLKERGVQL